MYKLDSGLISVIATIAAIAIGVYSSISEKKKARRRVLEQTEESGGEETFESVHQQEMDREPKMFNNPLEELFRAFKEAGQSETNLSAKENRDYVEAEDEDDPFSFTQKQRYIPEVQVEKQPIAPSPAAGREYVSISTETVVDEWAYDNGLDSIENSGVSLMDGVSVESIEDAFKEGGSQRKGTQDSLKERVKRSPKDVVLFSEILTPRYQAF